MSLSTFNLVRGKRVALCCARDRVSHFHLVVGNGKIKVKEPTDLAVKAMAQLSQAIDIAKSATSS